jgi:hypothetical protein
LGGTYSFTSNVVLDANVGYTRQVLGAQGFDIVSNFGLNVLQIPGTMVQIISRAVCQLSKSTVAGPTSVTTTPETPSCSAIISTLLQRISRAKG